MNKDTKNILTFTLALLAIVLSVCVAGKAQIQGITVPNEARFTDGTSVQTKTTFIANGNTLTSNFCMWWDVEFFLTNNGTAGKATVSLENTSGVKEVVAGFSSDGNTVVYDTWHAGAPVFYIANYYDVFQTGRIIEFIGNRSKTLDVNFEMQPYSNFIWNHGNTRIVFESEGGLTITPSSTVTMTKPGMVCDDGNSNHCATICMRDNFWWSRLSARELSRYSVSQFGMNFGNEVNASTPQVVQNIARNNANGIAAVFQLQFQRQQVPPQDAGWAECYGVDFEPFTVLDSDRATLVTVTKKTYLFEINRLIKVAIRNFNYEDFSKLLVVAQKMNEVRNCQ